MKRMKFFDNTEELTKILKASYQAAQEAKITEITVGNFIYSLFYYYFSGKGTDRKYNKSVKDFFSGLKEPDKKRILDALAGLTDTEEEVAPTYSDDLDLFDPTMIMLSDNMKDIFDDALGESKQLFPERMSELDTDVVLMAALKMSGEDEDCIEYLHMEGFESKVLYEIMVSNRKADAKSVAGLMDSLVKTVADGDPNEAAKFIGEILEKTGGEAPTPQANNGGGDGDEEREFEEAGRHEAIDGTELDPNSDTPNLDRYSVDLTKKAARGEFDPVIGRDDVVESMIEILLKRRKPNIALLSEAGTGKTAIIEKLAQRIASGEVPEKLQGKRICSLNLNDLVAGTQYRGQFEERLQKLIKEVCNNKDIIIALDELHTLVSGSAGGQNDTGNILKPYLARGEFQMIGATTPAEYRKYIEKDKALNRRFTQVMVEEPTQAETLKILKGIAGNYEKFHRVRYTPAILDLCVELSGKYMADKNFPDKAVDTMDMAGSLASLKRITEKKEDITEAEKRLAEVIELKKKAVMEDQDFEEAERLRNEEKALNEVIERETKATAKEANKRTNWTEVEDKDVIMAVSNISRIPYDKVAQNDREKLKFLREELTRTVIGQPEAIDEVMGCIQRAVLGVKPANKPYGVLLFSGETGVGKSYLAKKLAEIFYGTEKALVRFDMSSMTSEADVTRLLGAAPGYVRSDESGELIKVRDTNGGSCVLLFDEIEKANEHIYDVLLPILDEGRINLSSGELIDFSNTIIIFTSNIGTKEVASQLRVGFTQPTDEERHNKDKEIVQKAIEKKFKPEFRNRLTRQIVFRHFTRDDLSKVFNLELEKIKKQLNKSRLKIKVTPALKNHVLDECTAGLGARELNRNIERWVTDSVGRAMIDAPDAMSFTVDYDPATKKAFVVV